MYVCVCMNGPRQGRFDTKISAFNVKWCTICWLLLLCLPGFVSIVLRRCFCSLLLLLDCLHWPTICISAEKWWFIWWGSNDLWGKLRVNSSYSTHLQSKMLDFTWFWAYFAFVPRPNCSSHDTYQSNDFYRSNWGRIWLAHTKHFHIWHKMHPKNVHVYTIWTLYKHIVDCLLFILLFTPFSGRLYLLSPSNPSLSRAYDFHRIQLAVKQANNAKIHVLSERAMFEKFIKRFSTFYLRRP